MSEFSKDELLEHARENVKALRFASKQSAFKSARPAIERDLKLAEIALASLEREEPVDVMQEIKRWVIDRGLAGRANYTDEQNALLDAYMGNACREAAPIADDDRARQEYENHVRSRYQYPMLERHPEDGSPWHGEYKESVRQMEWEDWLCSWNACRDAMLDAAPAPVVPEPVSQSYKLPAGWVVVPKVLSAENGGKASLAGEFSETKTISCPECFGDEDCESCDGSGQIEIKVPVSWTTIKAIWARGVEIFALAPQQEAK